MKRGRSILNPIRSPSVIFALLTSEASDLLSDSRQFIKIDFSPDVDSLNVSAATGHTLRSDVLFGVSYFTL